MVETKKYQVRNAINGSILVEVRDLPLLYAHIAIEPKTDAASSAAVQ